MGIGKDIAVIAGYLRRHRNRYMEAFDLKSLHARYLIEICNEPGICQDELTQRLGFDKSHVARQAAFLEENGFLYRSKGQDKRMLCLYPTEKTLALLPGLQQATEQWEETLTQDLQPEEKAVLEALLARVRTRAEGRQ